MVAKTEKALYKCRAFSIKSGTLEHGQFNGRHVEMWEMSDLQIWLNI